MNKYLLAGAAAVGVASFGPALAQSAGEQAQANAPHRADAAQVHTRADMQARVAEHFARVDADRDGFVTKAEAASAAQGMRTRIRERIGERRELMFERLDANRDGVISRAEFDAAQAQRRQRLAGGDKGQHRGMHAMRMFGGRMFEAADANNDGRVSLQEAQATALRHFDMADANRDGQVTRDERRQMRQRMNNERRPG